MAAEPLTREQALEELAFLEAELARRRLLNFTRYVNPTYTANWHHEVMAQELDAVLAGKTKRLMLFMPPQHGKALRLDTPIPTPSGWKTIGDLYPGDRVFACDGTPTQVVARSPIWHDRPVYKITDDTGASVVADAAHEWAVRLCRKRQHVRTIWETEALYQRSCDISRSAMIDGAGSLQTSQVPLLVAPYTLGAWLGDGSTHYASITQFGEDRDHVIERVVAEGYGVHTIPCSEGQNFWLEGVQPLLRSIGVLKNKHIPRDYFRASHQQRLSLLQGLVDTDGHVAPDGQIEYSSKLERLAKDVMALVRTLGGKPQIHEGRATLDGRDCGPRWRVFWYLSESASCPRKAARCRTGIKASRRYLEDIRPDGTADTVCIQVAHESHLFLAGEGLMVTHNTELASRNLVPLALGRNPDLQVVLGTYNANRAIDVSKDIQRVMASDPYRVLFPKTKLAGGPKDMALLQALRFGVVGRRGTFEAAGIGQRISGKSMMLGIVDDPYGGRSDAESEAGRREVWSWWVGDFTTRQAGDQAAIVLIQTRWHEDDLAGRLLRLAKETPDADQWRVVSFPAICDQVLDGDPRQLGEALWPARFSLQWLKSTKAAKGVYDWESLYQQRPVPPGGAMGKREWFRTDACNQMTIRRCRAWDIAATKPKAGMDPDWTVGTLLEERTDGKWVVRHVVRMRGTPNEVDNLILATARGDGKDTLIREERVGLAGKVVEAAHTKLLAGYDYAAVPIGQTDKATRWRPFLVQAEAGNVHIVPGEWNATWLDELSMVPHGLHDDQADSVGLAFNELIAYKDYGRTASVILPQNRDGQTSDGQWRRRYFTRVEIGPPVEDVKPRRGIVFGEVQ